MAVPAGRAGPSVVPSAHWVPCSSLRLQSPSYVQAGLPAREGPAPGAEPLPLLSPSVGVGPFHIRSVCLPFLSLSWLRGGFLALLEV